ncbi:gamma-tubulin complex component 6 [Pelomyxa schiedti]|nr:gamma-tubulin complex component 6 [Pelomyxa schiedti]
MSKYLQSDTSLLKVDPQSPYHVTLGLDPIENCSDNSLPHYARNLPIVNLLQEFRDSISLQYNYTNAQLMDLLFNHLHLYSHLSCIHRYILLLDGNFADALVSSLKRKIEEANRQQHLKQQELEECLTAALHSCHLHGDSYASNLYFLPPSVSERPPFQKRSLSCVEEVHIHYQAHPWPLGVIVTPARLESFTKVSRFFIKIKYISCCLRSVWLPLKRVNSLHSWKTMRQFGVLRDQMDHFVKMLEQYVVTQMNELWAKYIQCLPSVPSLEALQNVLDDYLSILLQRCFLNEKAAKFHLLLQQALETVLQFYYTLAAVLPMHSQLDLHISQAVMNFGNLFHSHILKVLHTLNYQQRKYSHLAQLLLNLNFNNFYEL